MILVHAYIQFHWGFVHAVKAYAKTSYGFDIADATWTKTTDIHQAHWFKALIMEFHTSPSFLVPFYITKPTSCLKRYIFACVVMTNRLIMCLLAFFCYFSHYGAWSCYKELILHEFASKNVHTPISVVKDLNKNKHHMGSPTKGGDKWVSNNNHFLHHVCIGIYFFHFSCIHLKS